MDKKHFAIALALALTVATLLTACGSAPRTQAAQESHAKDALAQKYHTEFEIVQMYPQKLGDKYYEVQAYPAGDPSTLFTAAIDTDDDNCSSNYIERKVCSAIAASVEDALVGLPGDSYAFVCGVGPQPLTDDTDISVDEYIALDDMNKFRVELFAVLDDETSDMLYQSLSDALGNRAGMTAAMNLYAIDAEQMKAVREYFSKNDGLYFDYKLLTADYPQAELSYENGQLVTEESKFSAWMSLLES